MQRALERDPEARWQTAADLAEALETAATDTGGVASARQVAEHVRRVSGDKIASERARLKREVPERREWPAPVEATTADTTRTSRRLPRPVIAARIAALVASLAAATATYAWSRSSTIAPVTGAATSAIPVASEPPVDAAAVAATTTAPLTTASTSTSAEPPVSPTPTPAPAAPARTHPRSAPAKGDSIAPNPYNRH